MPETFSQSKRHISITTPLGNDTLLLKSISGREAMSDSYEYKLELQSEDPNIDFTRLIGHQVSATINLPGGGERHISGYINRFRFVHQGGFLTSYEATIVPQLWLLTQTTDCRIFQQKKVPDILEEVLQEHGISDYTMQLSSTYREWDYCVQYRETDFNFLNRLMEQEGIYYYFTHTATAHKMVMCDSSSNLDPFKDYGKLANRTMGQSGTKAVREDYFQPQVWGWTIEQEIRTGKVTLNDYNFTSPKAKLESNNIIKRKHGEADQELYDYPGEFTEAGEGTHYAKMRMQSLAAQHEVGCGKTDARGIATGHLFDLTDHPRKDQNREYLIISTELKADSGAFDQQATEGIQFESDFRAIPNDTPYRAPRRAAKPLVEGPQTAVVTGPSGEEIHCDNYGRVKVQFHWDRLGKKNENSSCWVRVSQLHAGKGWGSMHVPRIGEEVVVSFLEGDPDQPMITGRVYNADNMPVYALPANKTRSGYQSRSTKGGSAATFNELTFEDKKGEEQVYMHAELNMDGHIENNETRFVGNDRYKHVIHDETTEVDNDRTETVGNDETITIGNDRVETVGNNETITIGNDREEAVGNNETIAIAKNQEISIGENRTEDVGMDETITVGKNRTTEVGVNDDLTVSAKQTITVSAGREVKCPASNKYTYGQLDIKCGPSKALYAKEEVTSGDRKETLGKLDSTIGMATIKAGTSSATYGTQSVTAGVTTLSGGPLTISRAALIFA